MKNKDLTLGGLSNTVHIPALGAYNPLTPERAYTHSPKYGVHFAPKRD